MCTSVALRTKNRLSFLGRNMDFVDLPADYNIYVFPRNYQWVNREDQKNHYEPICNNRYGINGTKSIRHD
ncbi:linear amide C-N hydrolase [Cytobacillus kochii]|uniref:linear amide C-N hydrolase n=1 Tax=Cytobacillus kochii TaxID=859143 RepID=UPI0012FDAF47